MSEAPEWFRQQIKNGLSGLVSLSLPGQPPSDTIKLTRDSWIMVLWNGRIWVETDAERLSAAFITLARRCDRWPAPKALLDALPSRPARAALPEPKVSRLQRRKKFVHVRAILKSALNGKLPDDT